MEHVDVLVVGAGQAGLAVSHELTAAGVDHVVLERDRIGQAWRDRWDSFCLVTPNFGIRLPGFPYGGDDPDGYLLRDGVVAHLERYAATFGAPVRVGIAVQGLASAPDGGFLARTSVGDLRADRVVLSTGSYQRPHHPAGAEGLPRDLLVIDIGQYQNPGALPPGRILVVGSGQSGCQVAEELHEAGREVVLACGRAPWVPRRLGGRDIFWWVETSGFMDQTAASLPGPDAVLLANLQASGHDGGHDLHYRTLRSMGVTLAGHFRGARDGRVEFAPDLAESVAWGDARHRELMALVRRTAAERGLPKPEFPEPDLFDARAPESIPLDGLGAVVFAGGFRPDYRSWLPWQDAFDALGFPIQQDGRSTVVDGLYFVGVPFLRARKSSFLFGVGEDAAVVARSIAGQPPAGR